MQETKINLSDLLLILCNDLPRLLKNKRITQGKIAEVMEVHTSTINRWFVKDFTNANVKELIKLLTFLEKHGVVTSDYYKILLNEHTTSTETKRTIEQTPENDSQP